MVCHYIKDDKKGGKPNLNRKKYRKYNFGEPVPPEDRHHAGYFIGQYPVIIRVFPNRKGLNLLRWVWTCTNLFQRVRIGTFESCRLGYCSVQNTIYAGGDSWVIDMLRHGLCPSCGNQTKQQYFQRRNNTLDTTRKNQ